ncbi:MAG: VOC family protein [Saprospiraceae bacterium]|nr:VOC family protein [Saprospiraceae bacterium]
MDNQGFAIQFLDHVAIRVSDLERSAQWYERVLGLKRYTFDAWGSFPIFMLAGKVGIALFPPSGEQIDQKPGLRIDHFAFNVDRENFAKAQQHLHQLSIDFSFQDHTYFHSIYFRDPDGHQLELTTLVVAEGDFYGKS